jgi:multicomponent Na+:H+ antiporter subunit G
LISDALAASLGGTLLFLGLALATIGLYGLLRRRDIFEQLHAAGLVTGPGVILVLLASIATGRAEITTSAFLVTVFVLITSSLSTHVIALAAWRRREGRTAIRGSPRIAVAGSVDPSSATAVPVPMRVLVAHDGLPGADVAVGLAAWLPWPARSVIRVVGVLEGDLAPLSMIEPVPEQTNQEPIELAAALAAAVDLLKRPDVAVEQVVRRGRPAAEIIEEAAALDAQLVVVGTRGLGRVRSVLAGSVAAEVVDIAPYPVLIARSSVMREVLLAVDGSAESASAIEVVAGWPIFEDTHVHVLSVATAAPRHSDFPATRRMRAFLGSARQRAIADRAAMRLRDAGRAALPAVRPGDVSAAITAYADERSIDLIVIGSRGHTGLKRMFLGSVARDIVTSARTSVLVVKG